MFFPFPVEGEAFWFSQLSLTAFRSYETLRLVLDERPVVLLGENGSGKTNILEALSLFSPGRGLRRAALRDMQNDQSRDHPWAVAGALHTEAGDIRFGTGFQLNTQGNEKRILRLNGVPARSQQVFADHLSLLWLTPQLDNLFQESASERRRFIDRLITAFIPSHTSSVSAYQQALRSRARLLKEGNEDETWLCALEESLARHGVSIAASRQQHLHALAQAVAQGIGPFPAAQLALKGQVESVIATTAALEVEENLRAQYKATRKQDQERGMTEIGPHRTDLLVHHAQKQRLAKDCSTGEQKALLLSIVLAHARLIQKQRGCAPVLLLDEVAAHLDKERRSALFDELLELKTQFWATGTEEDLFSALGNQAQYFKVQEGVVAPYRPHFL